jgi:hypothetical protein
MNVLKLAKPNLNNARTRKRCLTAIGFCKAYLSDKPKPISKHEIDRVFSQGQNATSKWLRYYLLEKHHSHNMHAGTYDRYTLNKQGYDYVCEMLDLPQDGEFNANAISDFKLAVSAAIERYPFDAIEYRDKSDRYYHGAQNLRKSVRNEYLKANGLGVQYDLVCAAQSLLYQRYLQLKPHEPLDFIADYPANRNSIRSRLADELQLPIDAVKIIITAIFNNATVSDNPRHEIYKICQYDPARIEWIKQDLYLSCLRKEIKAMWKALKVDIDLGETRRVNGSLKAGLYRKHERHVMDVLITHIAASGKKYFIIHDCIATELNSFTTDELQSAVRYATGIDVLIEEELL